MLGRILKQWLPLAATIVGLGGLVYLVAQQSLRGVLCYCNSPLLNQVEAYIQFKPGLITADGEVTAESTADFLRNYMAEFHAFISRVYTVLPRNE